MWTCNKCGRVFKRAKQQHSCKTVPLEQHFENKALAKDLFYSLLTQITQKIGQCEIISLPCCIHLFGNYDFLAVLPHKDRIEVRFGSKSEISSPRIIQSVGLSKHSVKLCIDIKNENEIDTELLAWLNTAYFLKTI